MTNAQMTDAFDSPVPLAAIEHRVRELRTYDAASVATRLSCEYWWRQGDRRYSRLVNPINLSLLAKGVALWSDDSGRSISDGEPEWLLRALNTLQWYEREQIEDDLDETILSFLVRQAYVLNVLNDPDDANIARTYSIFHDCLEDGSVPVPNISAELQRVVGVNAEDLWVITFAIFAHYYMSYQNNPNHWTITSSFFSDSPRKHELAEKLTTVFAKIGRSPDELREIYNNNTKYKNDALGPAGWMSEFNILRDYPLLRIGEDSYCAPFPKFAFLRGAMGFYYDLLDDYAAQERRRDPNRNPYRNPMSKTFQILFQRYVGKQLRQLDKVGHHLTAEFSYGLRTDRADTPDWILRRPDRSCIFFECKARRPALVWQSQAHVRHRETDVRQTITHALGQFAKFLSRVDRQDVGLEVFHGLEHVIYALVMYDPFPFHAIPDLRNQIDTLARAEIRDWDALRQRITFVPMSIRELETAVGLELSRGIVLEQQFVSYAEYRERAPRVSFVNSGVQFPRHLEEYLQEKWNNSERIENPLCVATWDRFCEVVFDRIYDEDLATFEASRRHEWTQVAAFYLSEADGHPTENDWHYWFEAEKKLRNSELTSSVPPWLHDEGQPKG